MAMAALPDYIRSEDLSQASPGLRFGMYLRIWGEDQKSRVPTWKLSDTKYEVRGQSRAEKAVRSENKNEAIRSASHLGKSDLALTAALCERTEAVAAPLIAAGSMMRVVGRSTAPFTTGLGNEHPLENGFAFLGPYGLPYLPGSGIKGVLRAAARELATGGWTPQTSWSTEARYRIEADGDDIGLSMIELLFGSSNEGPASRHLRGALTFWDVLPKLPGNRLAVEIMTPHQSHYYQRDEGPHDSGSPTPIVFLTVPPGSSFVFYVQCDEGRLRAAGATDLLEGRWNTLVHQAFDHAFEWLGFGAKTAVGYGAMAPDAQAEREVLERADRRQRDDAHIQASQRASESEARLTPGLALLAQFEAAMQERVRLLRGARRGRVGDSDWARAQALVQASLEAQLDEEERAAIADAIEHWLPQVMSRGIDARYVRARLELGRLRGA